MITDMIFRDDEIVEIVASDLQLYNPDRRTASATSTRRALVHDNDKNGDRLTINYNGDYPDGVRIRGHTEIDALEVYLDEQVDGNLVVRGKITAGNEQVDGNLEVKGKITAGNEQVDGNLSVKGDLDVKHAITLNPGASHPLTLESSTIGGVFKLVGIPWAGHQCISLFAENIIVKNQAIPNIGGANYALSHLEGDTLVINRDGGFAGGVRVEGDVHFTGKLLTTIIVKMPDLHGGYKEIPMEKDVMQVIQDLQARVTALEKKVGNA